MTRGQERGRGRERGQERGQGQKFLKQDVEAPPIGELNYSESYLRSGHCLDFIYSSGFVDSIVQLASMTILIYQYKTEHCT